MTSMEIEAGSAAVADEPARMNVIRPVARDRIMNRVAMRAVCNDAGNYATPGGAGRILLALNANKGWSAWFRAYVKNWNGWHGPLARSVRRPSGRNGEGRSRADSRRSVFSPPALPVGESPTGTGDLPVPPILHTASERPTAGAVFRCAQPCPRQCLR